MNAEAPSELEFRKALTSVQPGDHLCLIYTGRDELFAALVPMLQAGLEKGERCIYVADEDPVEPLREALGKERRTLDSALESGRLLVLTKEQVYHRHGCFEPESVLQFWREASANASAAGFSGLRLFGDVSCASVEGPLVERILAYECKLTALARELSAIVVCLYQRTACGAEILLNALRTHPLVIYGEVVSRNPYYIPAEEFHASERAAMEVERLLTNLRERDQAQARVRETQERFTAFMDHLPAFAWIKDLEGRYLFINELLRTGVPSHAVGWQGKTDEELWPPDVAAEFRASDARVIAERATVQILEPYHIEEEILYGLVTKFPIFDRTGRLILLGGTSVNITDRIRAEQALRKSEERFRDLAENIHEIFWVENAATGRLEYVSPAYAQIWKRDPRDLMDNPKAWMDCVHPEDQAIVLASHFPPGERSHDHQYRIVWPDGAVRWIRDRAFPVRDATGRLTKVVGLAEDVTEAKLNEQALRKANERLQMVSRRLYEVQEHERRHIARELHDEIGQALTAAKINLKAASTAQPEAAALLGETAGILDGLLGKVREISLNLRPSLLDDLGLVPALRSLLDQQTRRGGLALQFYATGVPDSLDPETKIACFRIAQEALTNVLRHANARAVSLEMWVEEGEELHLTITDNGKGFPTAHLDQKGHRAESFGLIGIKERAELAGGVALILSTPGTGTIVDVRMPLFRKAIEEPRP